MKTKIYALLDGKGKVRYVGKTGKILENRLAQHIADAKYNKQTHKCKWIRLLLKHQTFPAIRLIEIATGDGCKEEKGWIAFYRSAGVKLTNATDGGEGISGYHLSKEARKRISQAVKGRETSEYTKSKLRAVTKAWWADLKNKAKRIPWNKGKKGSQKGWMIGLHHTEEAKRKMGETRKERHIVPWNKGRPHPEETRRKISESNKGRIVTKETRMKISKATKGRISEKRGTHLSKEQRQKMMKARKKRKEGLHA